MFSKILKYLPKKDSSNKSDIITEENSKNGELSTSKIPVKNKGWNSADMLFLGGLVLLIGGGLWFALSSTKDSEVIENKHTENTTAIKIQKEAKSNATISDRSKVIKILKNTIEPSKKSKFTQSKEKNAPFIYQNNVDFSTNTLVPPPEDYEKNNNALAKKISTPKKQIKQKIETKETTKNNTISKSKNNTVVNSSYVCTIEDEYQDMLGKEIIYYTKDTQTHTYIPIYKSNNWDESGVLVKKRLLAMQVDVNAHMVEIDKGQWIPALEFMTCILVQEDER